MSVKQNIAVGILVRLISVVTALTSVPLLLSLLGTQYYGVWVTLTSLIAFAGILDLGIGNSLVNSFSRAVDSHSMKVARYEYANILKLATLLSVVVMIIFLGATRYIGLLYENRVAAVLLYVPVILGVPLMLSGSILQGQGQTGVQAFFGAASTWLFLCSAYVIEKYGVFNVEIWHLAALWGGFYFIILLIQTLYVSRRIRFFWLNIRTRFEYQLIKTRVQLGAKFLVLQISSLILYGIGNVIIYNKLGPVEVAEYDIVNKIFQTGLGIYSIVIATAWAKIGQSIAENDKNMARKIYILLWISVFIFGVGAIVVAELTPNVVELWTNAKILTDRSISRSMALLVSLQAGAYVGAVYLNAFEKIEPQIYLGIVSILFMVPLSDYLFKLGLNASAVPLSSACLTLLPFIVCNHQAMRLIKTMRSK